MKYSVCYDITRLKSLPLEMWPARPANTAFQNQTACLGPGTIDNNGVEAYGEEEIVSPAGKEEGLAFCLPNSPFILSIFPLPHRTRGPVEAGEKGYYS